MVKARKNIKKKRSVSRKKNSHWLAFFKSERLHFLLGVIIAFTGIFIFLSMISFLFTGAADQSKVLNRSFVELVNDKNLQVENWTGVGGAFIAERLINGGFGIFSILIPFFIAYIGLRLMKVSNFSFFNVLFFTALGLIGGSIASAFVLGKLFPDSHINWGGSHGVRIEQLLESSIGWPGVILVILLFIIVFRVLIRKNSVQEIRQTLVNDKPKSDEAEEGTPDEPEINKVAEETEPETEQKPSFLKRLFRRKRRSDEDDEEERENEQESGATDNVTMQNRESLSTDKNDFEVVVPKDEEPVIGTPAQVFTAFRPDTEVVDEGRIEILEDYDPRKDLSAFRFPTTDLLKTYHTGNREVNMQEQNENKDKIIHTLRNYGIEITSIKATVGPTVTLYEIVPQAGVRISRIRNLEDDIALSLSALGIRIIAPMPGKGTIGIEVPNKDPQIVSMHSVISSKKFQECTYDLPVALGKTITNEVFIFDLTKMPHLLVAGATGQGKSVGLNAIITSLLYKKHPAEMKLVLIDPKMVEFNIYSIIERHYLAKLPDEEKAIITDVTKVTQTLNSLTKEMDDRYELLMRAHVRTIKEYNEKFVKRRLNPNNGHRYMPYIVVVIDEFGDLIMTAGKEIEMPIARIAQKARAVGIHMVIATQRPTTNIITGTIKANFPARMAFRVTSQIDSRTILDMNGANQLTGRGDLLFSQGNNLIRIQCAFVDTPEIDEIARYIGSQRGYETAYALPEVLTDEGDKPGAVDLNERDTLFEEAARLIVIHQQGSTSLIQRKFSIGYNRAGRLMDQLEAAGIVGPAQGSKPRDVYISDEYSLEKLLDSLR
ncbi:FtsK/SpoIIIE family DNA translocase [Anaerorudis cellulosivorans]|uniref:FtsK/SpoIIIE family DNA translocase n=1 Tax=Anaerorudis cellulosivorans TaxID=3397862 RepID=UPI00221F1FAF|nr:DNA translocase FtsK [Seramator thermalis]MCW1735317.1 DNA translocase FtsK [Seramator thermalis]